MVQGKLENKKIGILGGSFDPAHVGHVRISKLAKKNYNLSQVIWAITKQNPFKKNNPNINSSLRTFGFGYELNAKLLQSLSHNAPTLGSFSFIPDTGFIGTVMGHAMANTIIKDRVEESSDIKLFLEFIPSVYIFSSINF